jgi:hypothetical protein
VAAKAAAHIQDTIGGLELKIIRESAEAFGVRGPSW